MPPTPHRRTPLRTTVAAIDKRDAILRAATEVFARHGFFQSQVADVARAAGVAAGTVYLYFRSKDEILVSIFERTMREAIAEGRAALERRGRSARAAAARGATAPRASRPRPRSRRRLSGRVAPVHQVHGAFFLDVSARLHRHDPRGHRQGSERSGLFRQDINATTAAKMFFGALDEMATNWILSRRRYSLAAEADVVDRSLRQRRRPAKRRGMIINAVAVLGAGTMGAQIALHCANAGIPSLLLDLTPELARDGLEKARRLKPDPQFTPDAHRLVTTAGFDAGFPLLRNADWILEAVVERLDIKQQLLARIETARKPGSIVSSNTSGIPIGVLAEGRSDEFRRHWIGHALLQSAALPEAAGADSNTGNGSGNCRRRHAIRRPSPRQGRRRREGHAQFHRQSHRALRRRPLARGGRRAAATRSKRWTRSPARRSAVRAAPRSERWTSPASTCSRTSCATSRSGSPTADRAAFVMPAFLQRMLDKGLIGEKAGHGFYERRRKADGESEIWTHRS